MIKTNIERFTPEDAEKALKKMLNPRPYTATHGDYFARIIDQGIWEPEMGTPAIFDEQGRLRTFQHRMRGIILSGKAVDIKVARDVPNAIAERISMEDKGVMPRKLCDAVSFLSDRKSRMMAVSVIALERGMNEARWSKMTDVECANGFARRAKELRWFARCFGKFHGYRGIGRVGCILAFADYYKMNADKAQEFGDCFYDFTNNAIQQAVFLRSYLLMDAKGGICQMSDTYNRSAYCMACHFMGNEVKKSYATGWEILPDMEDEVKVNGKHNNKQKDTNEDT